MYVWEREIEMKNKKIKKNKIQREILTSKNLFIDLDSSG